MEHRLVNYNPETQRKYTSVNKKQNYKSGNANRNKHIGKHRTENTNRELQIGITGREIQIGIYIYIYIYIPLNTIREIQIVKLQLK